MDSFERLFKDIERELVDLKTTAKRGLGSIAFYQKTKPAQKMGATSITIKSVVTIASGEPLPAFLTIFTPLGFRNITTVAGTTSYTVNQSRATSSPVDYNGSVIATSSAEIASLSVEVS